jgi:hypothetical protein
MVIDSATMKGLPIRNNDEVQGSARHIASVGE